MSPDYRINPDGPYVPFDYDVRSVEPLEVAAVAPLGDIINEDRVWTPDEERIVFGARGEAYLKLRGFVYAERVGEDTHTVPVTVTTRPQVPYTIPGARIWWKPWARHPDTTHYATAEVSTTVDVDITRIAWVKVPDAPPFPKTFGRPIPFVAYEGSQRHDR